MTIYNYFEKMPQNYKIMLGVGAVVIVIIIIYLLSRKKENIVKVEQQNNFDHNTHHIENEHKHNIEQKARAITNMKGVLVMFFAPWCSHCKNMAPAWYDLTNNFDGYNGIRILKLNGQENPELAQLHNVNGYPFIKYCPNGIDDPDGVIYEGDRSVNSLVEFLQRFA